MWYGHVSLCGGANQENFVCLNCFDEATEGVIHEKSSDHFGTISWEEGDGHCERCGEPLYVGTVAFTKSIERKAKKQWGEINPGETYHHKTRCIKFLDARNNPRVAFRAWSCSIPKPNPALEKLLRNATYSAPCPETWLPE